MATTTIPQARPSVIIGVDTHKDVHVARAKEQLGRLIDEQTIPATAAGYRSLLTWARSLGDVEAFGIEGTGSFGAGLTRFLLDEGQAVLEVTWPNRQRRRRNGKSDPADADAAASAVLSGEASGLPKSGDGPVEMIRALRLARKTAVKAHTQAINTMKALIVTASPDLRESLPRSHRSTKPLVRACAEFKEEPLTSPLAAHRRALGSLAVRCLQLEVEIAGLTGALDELVARTAP